MIADDYILMGACLMLIKWKWRFQFCRENERMTLTLDGNVYDSFSLGGCPKPPEPPELPHEANDG